MSAIVKFPFKDKNSEENDSKFLTPRILGRSRRFTNSVVRHNENIVFKIDPGEVNKDLTYLIVNHIWGKISPFFYIQMYLTVLNILIEDSNRSILEL